MCSQTFLGDAAKENIQELPLYIYIYMQARLNIYIFLTYQPTL